MRLPPFKLERFFARYEFNVEFVLCGSDCESHTIKELLALEPGAAERFEAQWLGYTESAGSPTLRQEISRLYDGIAADQVLVHAGAEEAVFIFMNAVLTAGDHVVVHAPCYQSLIEIPRSLGCEVTPWKAQEQRRWALDLEELRHSLRSNTKVIVVNTPHNPTGYLMAREDFQALNRLAETRGIVVFSDEVYRESEHRPEDRLPAACEVNDRAVSLGVMSKTYGLPGLRIGWIATRNQEVWGKMAALKDYSTICSSAPSEFLAELALRHRRLLVERNLRIIGRNLARLDEFFAGHAERFAWQRPRAGPIAFPRLIDDEVETFCHELASRAGVLLLPGTVYDDTQNHFRIGFGRRNMPEAVGRLEEHLRKKR